MIFVNNIFYEMHYKNVYISDGHFILNLTLFTKLYANSFLLIEKVPHSNDSYKSNSIVLAANSINKLNDNIKEISML